MKMLLIGMDGAQQATFSRGWTPYILSLIENGRSVRLKEDLISRGWAEIVTGQHALATRALYEGPVLHRTYTWTDKFKLDNIPGLGSKIKPLWQVLSERGYRVGIMNVPTAYPAPKVNGFFVSGGGGGGAISQDLVAEQCHPSATKDSLNEMGYIADERLPSLLAQKKLYEPGSFFSRLKEMNEKRTQAFISLSKKYNIDFGFLVYKSSIVTAETLLLPELDRHDTDKRCTNEEFCLAANDFFCHFDKQVEKLVRTFSMAEIILVSDHAMASRQWSVNANAFLIEKGYQNPSFNRRGIYDFIKASRHWIPFSLRQQLKKSDRIKSAYESMITFEPKTSLAFSLAFSNGAHGIYINDNERFGGPVEKSDFTELQSEIILSFNRHPATIEHGFKAYAKPKLENDTCRYFPDIILELPDGYLTTNEFPQFVKKFIAPDNPVDLKAAEKDIRCCAKGHYPLALNANGNWLASPNAEKQDLRVIYDHIIEFFK